MMQHSIGLLFRLEGLRIVSFSEKGTDFRNLNILVIQLFRRLLCQDVTYLFQKK
jgi:hypothetical protein